MEKLATKNPKAVAELYKILDATTKAADTEDKKKSKDMKRKTGEPEVLVTGKGKAPSR